MAGIRTKAGIKNIANVPVATKTCKKCSRSWTEDHFRDKRGAPTQLCRQCREASNKSAKIASEARVGQQPAPATPGHHPPSVPCEAAPAPFIPPTPSAPHEAALDFQSPSQVTPSRMLNQDLLSDMERNMAAQPGAMSSFTPPAPSYHGIQAPGQVNLRVNAPAPAIPSCTDADDYEETKVKFVKPTSRDNGAGMAELDPQPQRPLLNFEIQSMAVRAERATTAESSAAITRTSSDMPEGTDLAMVAREGEAVSININLLCRFARQIRG
ncbi:hypothetical protein BDW75DRAFT_239509 [Aspergillus navahoensis]